MTKTYYRPIVQTEPSRPAHAMSLAGGWAWFDQVECLTRTGARQRVAAHDIPADVLEKLTAPRPDIAGLSFARPRLMGILNVTPDSFSDGGRFLGPDAAQAQARALVDQGADMLDIGGESTRPGAAFVPEDDEVARTAPVIAALKAADFGAPISIDTRKSEVAQAALNAGADLVNDVSAFGYDTDMARVVASAKAPVCLMHAQGTPATMQQAPSYVNVLLDVFDFLEEKITTSANHGIPRSRIVVDPGIGFGKTLDHNLTLLRGISLFHGLGCAVLVGASRKRFIGTVTGVETADQRVPGSVAVALAAAAQGVQMLRVHDMTETRQALTMAERLWGDR